jgi:glucose-1-phosphate thymidylyltransferase
MKGVILAAGKGSRLYPVTHIVPKPLLPLANKTTLAYCFERLKEMGVDDLCLVVGENETKMREALGDGSAFDVRLSYVRQTDPHGLAHAVGFAKDFVAGDPFVLYLGDAIYSKGFHDLKERFAAGGIANLSAVKPVEDPTRFGVANVEGDRIVKLVEKPKVPESNLAMAGLYFFGPELWDVLPDLKPSARGEYEITDAIQMLVDRGHNVIAGHYQGEWFDTGTLDSFLETSAFLTGGKSLSAAAQLQGQLGENTVIGAGASVSCAHIEDSVILPGANVRVSGVIRHSILAGDVTVDGDAENLIVHGDYKG